MIPELKLEAVTRREAELSQLLCDPEVHANPKRLQELNRERGHLLPIVEAFAKYRALQKQIKEDREALSDPELGPLAAEELPELEARLADLDREILILLLPTDPNDEKNVLLEIRGGTGGEEAALFANDLFRMYLRYAEQRRWKTEVLSISEAQAGGLKEAVVLIAGDRVYSSHKYHCR